MPTKKQTLSERVAQLERQLAEMHDLVAAQGSKVVVSAEAPKAMSAAAAATGSGPVPSAFANPVPGPAAKVAVKEDGVSPEILAVIAATVAHFLGKSFRVRSARLVHPAGSNPWAQQGRVFIQASHNLAMQR